MENKYNKVLKKPRIIFGVIGLIIGLIPLNEFVVELLPHKVEYMLERINDLILYVPRSVIENIFDCLSCESFLLAFFVLFLINITFYILIGFILGLIIEFLFKNIKQNKMKKKK